MTSSSRQSGALVRRYWIHESRTPIRTFLKFLAWPGLLLFGFIKYLSYTGYLSQDRPVIVEEGPMTIMPEQMIAVVLHLILTIHVYNYVDYLVADKVSGMKSLMLSMGLKKQAYYLAHSLCFLATTAPIVATVTVLSTMYLFQGSRATYLAIAVMFGLFALHLLTVMFALASAIHSTSLSSLVIIAAVFELLIHKFLEWLMGHTNDNIKSLIMFTASIDPFESLRIFVDSYRICKNCNKQQVNPELGVSQPTMILLAAMAFWTLLTLLFAVWFDEVCPWQRDRAPKSVFFCCQSGGDAKSIEKSPLVPDQNQQHNSKYFEAPRPGRQVGIGIKSVSKKFSTERVVDNVNFDIYNGETTLLLGHNGAGKTTLMNMILGKVTPTEGRIQIFDAAGGVQEASIGVCPQSSIYDERLTVRQHLELFAKIKSSLHGGDLAHDIRTTMHDVSLQPQADQLPSELSGGMRRKLSLGMAFVGKSSILILDEPSSGLDPDSRVFVWNAIRRYRAERTVLLSTQHMEEADYLGDRIAIMSAGRIVCCGSSIFLNNTFGSGYKLRIECLASRRKEILEMVRRYFESAKSSEEERVVDGSVSKKELSIDMVVELIGDKSALERSEQRDDHVELNLIKMLQEIESRSDDLGIKAHGLRSSSIEDVLLNTSKLSHVESKGQVKLSIDTSGASQLHTVVNPLMRRETNWLVDQAFFLAAFMKKHLATYKGDWKMVFLFRVALVTYACWYIVKDKWRSVDAPANYMPSRFAFLVIFHFLSYPIKEKVSKFKIMQLTSLANIYVYWISQLLIDMLTVAVATAALNAFIEVELSNELHESPSRLNVHLIASAGMLLFGAAGALNCYVLSTFFSESSTALAYVVIYFLFGIVVTQVLIPVVLITFKIKESIGSVQTVASAIFIIIYPTEAYQYVLYGLVVSGYIRPVPVTPSSELIGSDGSDLFGGLDPIIVGFVTLAGQTVVFGLLLYLIELHNLDPSAWLSQLWSYLCCCLRCRSWIPLAGDSGVDCDGGQIDGDVLDERRKARRTINSQREAYQLVAHDLSMSYKRSGPKAVDHLSFTVSRGECFGLLGVNGAGKSTTFSMLVGESKPDSGRIWLRGSIYSDTKLHAYRQKLGYDPQENPNIGGLTPVEALSFMARLRRVDEQNIPTLVSCLLLVLDMSEHANKSCGKLSGGTRRKLALGMSLIGNPEILALDEPTAGVDPIARRGVWQLLRSLRSQKRVPIVISSHAMEECEAICDRISIMARGRLRCIGTFLHLRTKFSQGCTVRVQFIPTDANPLAEFASNVVPDLTRRLQRLAGNSVRVADLNINSASFSIASTRDFKRSALFKLMRDFRQVHKSMSYIVNDSSLEDIFLMLAREQQQTSAGSATKKSSIQGD